MNKKEETIKESLKTILTYLFIGIAIFVVTRTIIEPTVVVGNSMNPTLEEGNYMLNYKLAYRDSEDVNYEDIVIVSLPGNDKHLVKRVVGKPNDVVRITNNELYINGEKKEEPYIKEEMRDTPDMEVTLEEDQVFVMGDNRNNSLDSRVLGPVNLSNIRGEVVFQLFPFHVVG